MIPYRITIEIATPDGKGKTIQVSGTVPTIADPMTNGGLTQIASQAMLYQAQQMAYASMGYNDDPLQKFIQMPTGPTIQ